MLVELWKQKHTKAFLKEILFEANRKCCTRGTPCPSSFQSPLWGTSAPLFEGYKFHIHSKTTQGWPLLKYFSHRHKLTFFWFVSLVPSVKYQSRWTILWKCNLTQLNLTKTGHQVFWSVTFPTSQVFWILGFISVWSVFELCHITLRFLFNSFFLITYFFSWF